MTYSYECKDEKCKYKFNIEKGINEEIEIICLKCGSKDVKRIYTPISNVWNCQGSYNQTRK